MTMDFPNEDPHYNHPTSEEDRGTKTTPTSLTDLP